MTVIKECMCCHELKEHASYKSTTCNECLSIGIKACSSCGQVKKLDDFYLCRGKPMGMCRDCEKKRSQQGKVDNGYYEREDVRLKRNQDSAEWHAKRLADPTIRRAVYDRHNERLRERYATDANYKEHRIQQQRARHSTLDGTITGDEWLECLEYFDNACAYCGSTSNITRDHIEPVSKGGLNLISNIVPACKSCNSSKRNKPLVTWYTSQKFATPERLDKVLNWMKREEVMPNASKRN